MSKRFNKKKIKKNTTVLQRLQKNKLIEYMVNNVWWEPVPMKLIFITFEKQINEN